MNIELKASYKTINYNEEGDRIVVEDYSLKTISLYTKYDILMTKSVAEELHNILSMSQCRLMTKENSGRIQHQAISFLSEKQLDNQVLIVDNDCMEYVVRNFHSMYGEVGTFYKEELYDYI